MARIKDFVSSENGRARKLEFEHKIKAHRRERALKIFTVTAIAILLIVSVSYLWANSVYSSYTEIRLLRISTIPEPMNIIGIQVSFQTSILQMIQSFLSWIQMLIGMPNTAA